MPPATSSPSEEAYLSFHKNDFGSHLKIPGPKLYIPGDNSVGDSTSLELPSHQIKSGDSEIDVTGSPSIDDGRPSHSYNWTSPNPSSPTPTDNDWPLRSPSWTEPTLWNPAFIENEWPLRSRDSTSTTVFREDANAKQAILIDYLQLWPYYRPTDVNYGVLEQLSTQQFIQVHTDVCAECLYRTDKSQFIPSLLPSDTKISSKRSQARAAIASMDTKSFCLLVREVLAESAKRNDSGEKISAQAGSFNARHLSTLSEESETEGGQVYNGRPSESTPFRPDAARYRPPDHISFVRPESGVLPFSDACRLRSSTDSWDTTIFAGYAPSSSTSRTSGTTFLTARSSTFSAPSFATAVAHFSDDPQEDSIVR